MNVYTNNQFEGRWPVGTAAVVVADSKEQAAKILEAVLKTMRLEQKVKPDHMTQVDLNSHDCIILNDGDY